MTFVRARCQRMWFVMRPSQFVWVRYYPDHELLDSAYVRIGVFISESTSHLHRHLVISQRLVCALCIMTITNPTQLIDE